MVPRVQAIRLGGFVVSVALTQFSQDTSGIFAVPYITGTIGAQMLRRFTVVFDYPQGQMILEPNEHFGDPSQVRKEHAPIICSSLRRLQVRLVQLGAFPVV